MLEKINNRPWHWWGLPHEIGCSNDKEDDFFIELLQNKKNGFIVDAGACDGVTGSNSFKLINQYNWKALLIECNKQAINYLEYLYCDNSNIFIENIAVALEIGKQQLYFSQYPGTHSVSKEFVTQGMHADYYTGTSTEVEGDTLNNIISKNIENKKIDILSLDIEGMDLEIIKQFDFTVNKPSIVCVEWPSGTRDRDYSIVEKNETNIELIEQMKKQNYKLVKSTFSNAIFYNSEWL
jgi:FkbM family methyltransferase